MLSTKLRKRLKIIYDRKQFAKERKSSLEFIRKPEESSSVQFKIQVATRDELVLKVATIMWVSRVIKFIKQYFLINSLKTPLLSAWNANYMV
jgi:uncharacterized protein YegJ (DUF2314 family)